jgi:glucosamine--fructose-6-phosphate aminotransferase (isomerizing)
MCGIIAYLGISNGFSKCICGLKQLQNRGYDSAGYCGIKNNKLECVKYASTTTDDSIMNISKLDGSYTNIHFHNRWATHGPKTDINSHPHIDYKNRISLVHNGMIENYYELKQQLQTKGITFKSQTDSEVIVNLISHYYDKTIDEHGIKHMEEAIMQATKYMQGTWALSIICIDKPDNMYCVRHGSPLLIGFAEDYIMVASEQSGFCTNVTNYICLNNQDITVIRRRDNKINFENITNYKVRDINTTINELTPHPYTHWTIKEIHEQYEAAIRAIGFGGRLLNDSEVLLGGPHEHTYKLKQVDHLILLGCGTSLNAGKHGVHFFKDLCKFTTVQAFDGSEFNSSDIPQNGKTALVFLSQSGESRDLHKCIKIGRDAGLFLIGVINVVDSQIARDVDCGCYINAGREVAVASTKAFTNQVIILSMLAIFFAQIHNINHDKRKHYISCLRQLPIQIKETLKNTDKIAQDVAQYLKHQKSCFILGKGSMISIAEEGALKTKEIGYIHSEAYGGNALRHGPYALLEKGTPIIFVNPYDEHFLLMNNTIEEVVSRHAIPVSISDKKCTSQHAKYVIIVQENDVYKGILHNIPLQLIAYHLSCVKEINCDYPRGLAKCVSV